MRFQVTGAYRKTAEDVSLDVSAGSAAEAEARANSMGILVERVKAVGERKQSREVVVRAPGPPPVATCPYCRAELKKRKPPKRRSAFECRACGEQIMVDPQQYVYPSVYLTEKQAEDVDFLWQLDHWVFTKGSKRDYLRAKKALAKASGKEPDVEDVIWALMKANLEECAARHSNQAAKIAKLFNGAENAPNVRDYEGEQLRELMEQFRARAAEEDP